MNNDNNILERIIETDGELDHEHFNLDLARLVKYAEPWGQEFPEPVFHGTFEIIEQKILADKHLKLKLAPVLNNNSNIYLNAIAFNIDTDKWPNYKAKEVNIVYKLDINVYSGLTSLQLMVDYIEAKIQDE